MKLLRNAILVSGAFAVAQLTYAHYPYVAPLAYQTFNNHSAIISGFYDNPFASEIHIKKFKFHYHTPTGEKLGIQPEQWVETQSLSAMTLENKVDGTYRIRGEKQGSQSRFAYVDKQWKTLLQGQANPEQKSPNVVYSADLKKNTHVKTVQTVELIESFVSRRETSRKVIDHLHDGFDIQFITHPNAIRVNQPVQFKVLDDQKGVANLQVEIIKQTTDFSRESKVFKIVKTNTAGELNFDLMEKGQYLLKVDYQQPFSLKSNDLKRFKYTLSFNVID